MPATSTDRLLGTLTSVAVKAPCKAVTTTAITLAGEQAVGGVACVSGERVLVAISGGSVNNGIWVVDTGAWSRAKDFDGNRDVVQGTLVLVKPGSTSRFWQVQTEDPIIIGTTAIVFSQLDPSAMAGANGYVNVRDLGALGDGVTDDTAAFSSAIASGLAVYVPYSAAGYVVNDVPIGDDMTIFGDRRGSIGGSMLIVTGNNKAAFRHTASTERYNVSFRDLSCKSSNNANTTYFYRQDDKSHYTAYATFENIETWGSLTVAYDGFFIFADWINCRTGYFGTVGAQHTFIQSLPVSYGQANATNICSIERCKIFNCVGGNAAVDLAYGVLWSVENTDFENLAVRAVRARAVQGLSFDYCWFEGQSGGTAVAESVLLDVYPATAAGTYPVTFSNCVAVVPNVTGYFCNAASSLCQANFENMEFAFVAAGSAMANDGTRLGFARNVLALSGAGAASYFNGLKVDTFSGGKRYFNGATDDGSGADFQQLGRYRASGGFNSTRTSAIGTSFTTIFTTQGATALVFVNAANDAGGAQGWWLLGVMGTGALVTTIASQNSTGLTVSFQLSGNNLQAKTAAGAMTVSAAALL